MLLLSVLPSIILFIVIWKCDRYEKEPPRLLLKLFLFGIAADILAAMIGLGWIATLARLYLMYKGITNALNGRKEPLPYIGTLGDK